ncbi:MAG: DUF2975 domain-containing protein, partial [Candidatus Latescibacterota bacterium]
MKALGKGSIAWVLGGLLTIAWWLTVLAGSAVVLAFVVMLFTGTPSSDLLDAPIDFELDPGVYSVNAKSLGASAVTIKDATGMLAFDSGSRPVIAAYLIIVIVVVAVLLFILHQLRRIFRSLAEGRPFSAENAARIRMIGLVVVFGELAESLFVFVTQLYVVSSV